MARIGTGGGKDSLKLQGCHHIRQQGISVVVYGCRIKRCKTCGQNNGAHMYGQRFWGVLEIDGARWAEFLAGAAFAFVQIDAIVRIDCIFKGYRLGVWDVNGFSLRQTFIVFIGHFFGTFFSTHTACDTFVHIHIARLLNDPDGEIPFLSGNLLDFRQGNQLDINVPADLDQFG